LIAKLQGLALTLLVSGVRRTNHPDHTITPHHFAVTTHFLYRSSHFHRKLL